VEVHRANIKPELELKREIDVIRYAIRLTKAQNPP
jgi:hypothetical protein